MSAKGCLQRIDELYPDEDIAYFVKLFLFCDEQLLGPILSEGYTEIARQTLLNEFCGQPGTKWHLDSFREQVPRDIQATAEGCYFPSCSRVECSALTVRNERWLYGHCSYGSTKRRPNLCIAWMQRSSHYTTQRRRFSDHWGHVYLWDDVWRGHAGCSKWKTSMRRFEVHVNGS